MKRILSLIVFIALTVNTQAVSISAAVAANSFTNVLALMPNGLAKITSITATANGASAQVVTLYDSATGFQGYSNLAYITTTSYLTNTYVPFTNYFGHTNGWITNIMLVDLTNTVAAVSNPYPIRAVVNIPASSSVTLAPVNYQFDNGLWITNSGASSVTFNVNAYTY